MGLHIKKDTTMLLDWMSVPVLTLSQPPLIESG